MEPSDPMSYFDSPEFVAKYEEEADKQSESMMKLKLAPLERVNRTMMLQEFHRRGQYDEMTKLIEETAKNYQYSIDFEISPTRDLVSLIISECRKIDQKGIVSIGCSTGLLEFFLEREILKNGYDMKVYAVELPRGPTFFMGLAPAIHRSPFYYDYTKVIDIDYRETFDIKEDQALLMCFGHHSDKIWQRYLKAYKGNCIVIIGKKYYTLPYPGIFEDVPGQTKDVWEEVVNVEVLGRNPGTRMSIYRKKIEKSRGGEIRD